MFRNYKTLNLTNYKINQISNWLHVRSAGLIGRDFGPNKQSNEVQT
jgi:hypothetical protein